MGAYYRQNKAKGFEALFAAVNENPNVPAFIQQYQVPLVALPKPKPQKPQPETQTHGYLKVTRLSILGAISVS